jgi:magnesium-transporting ATPase (P-type)
VAKKEPDVTDMTNILFSGSLVIQGAGLGVVCLTGQNTQIGKIHSQVFIAFQMQEAKEDKEQSSPLQLRLEEFGDQLAKLIGVVCVTIWVMNFNNFFDEVRHHHSPN